MSGWWIGGIAVAITIWSFGLGILVEDRIFDWYLARSGTSALRAGVAVVGTHVLGLIGWFAVYLGGSVAAERGGDRVWAGLVVLPALLLYGPWLVQFLPAGRFGFSFTREDLGRRGATRGVARAITWSGAPFAPLGLGLMTAAFIATFVVG